MYSFLDYGEISNATDSLIKSGTKHIGMLVYYLAKTLQNFKN